MTGLLLLEQCLADLELVRERVAAKSEERYSAAFAAFPTEFENLDAFRKAVDFFCFDVTDGTPRIRDLRVSEPGGYFPAQQIWTLLRQAYHADDVAFRVCKQNLEGGRREFVARLFTACIEYQIEFEATVILWEFERGFGQLKFPEQQSLATVYFERSSHLLPPDVTENLRGLESLKLASFLRKHSSLVHALR